MAIVKSHAVTNAVAQLPAAASIAVYPDPATNHINVSIPDAAVGSETVLYDMHGRQAAVKNAAAHTKSVTFGLGSLPRGAYLLEVKTGNSRFSKKIIPE